MNRRIAKTVDGTATIHTLNGDAAWADFDGNGNVKSRYLFGDNIDEILARQRPGEGVAWYLTDRLGTVRDLVNNAGAILNRIDYDSFGNILRVTNEGQGDRFMFTGREWDAESNHFFYRARYYDPSRGRFVSEDPLRFAGGDTNLYRYAFNDPLDLKDPSGMLIADSSALRVGAAFAVGYLLGRTVAEQCNFPAFYGGLIGGLLIAAPTAISAGALRAVHFYLGQQNAQAAIGAFQLNELMIAFRTMNEYLLQLSIALKTCDPGTEA
jgi:RHS repeat-associated protein